MDPKLAVKHQLLQQLLGEARGRMAGKLKAKYAPPAPAPAPAVEVEIKPPAEGEHQPLSDEELAELLANEG